MSENILSAREAITEALSDLDGTLGLTHSLTPLYEDAHSASISVHGSLEAAASGLSYFIEKISLATEAGALTVEQSRESAIEAGKDVGVELGIAIAGLVAITTASKDMYNTTAGEPGIIPTLKMAEKTASPYLPASSRFIEMLNWGIVDASALSKMLALYTDVTNPRELYLSVLNERLKESVLILVNSTNRPIHEYNGTLAAVQKKITLDDLGQLSRIVEVSDAVKELFAFTIPEQQGLIQTKIQRAKNRGEEQLRTL